MKFWMAAVLGIVQGVAEFLPISSSGHLSLLQYFFGMEEPDALYNILLHFATLVAVCVVYRRDIAGMIVEFFRLLASLFSGQGRRERGNPPEARRMILLLILGTLPLFLVLPIEDFVEDLGSSPVFVSLMLLVTGCILFLSDRYGGGRKDGRTATVKDVVLVGLAQGLATIPGLSRSGATISAGMALGFDRGFAVRFSFLLSIPAILGANLLSLKDAFEAGILWEEVPVYLAGVAASAVVGYACIRLLKLIAERGRFGFFAYYCWLAGAVTLVLTILQTQIPQGGI